jgi:hypothetical protein
MLGRAAGRVLFFFSLLPILWQLLTRERAKFGYRWKKATEKKLRIHYVWRPSRTYYLNMGDFRFFFLKMWLIFPKNPLSPLALNLFLLFL